MIVATDWHLVGERIVDPDSVFWHALAATVYIAVLAQLLGVVLGLVAALMRMSRFRAYIIPALVLTPVGWVALWLARRYSEDVRALRRVSVSDR